MAAALVGEAVLSAVIDVLIDKIASGEVVNFFKRKKLDDGQLKKLKETMRSVNKALNDAEVKQIDDPAVKAWLDDLRDAVYRADDFLDGIAYEALQLEMEAGPQTPKSTISKVRNFLSSLNLCRKGMRMGEKEAWLEEILQNLEGLVQQKDTLGLIDGIGRKSWSPKMPTSSLPDDSVVYGRDDDKKAILNLLLSADANGNKLGVIPIVGMGGMGKTTLAQLVYNDCTVQQQFDLKAWVCVAEEFDFLKITRDILKEFGLSNCDAMTPNQLHLELEKHLKGNKFLLVLDDVWNDDLNDWSFLLKPLKSGSLQVSKIIVTTRNSTVASVISRVLLTDATVSTHPLHELSQDDCWFVFARHAFNGRSSSMHDKLEEIGRKIVRKCKGLPLAAKILGGLLHSNTDAEEWEKILESNMWDLEDDKILPALRLSYYYLPPPLKQCFAYCALFPKDYGFRKEVLVLLWMAEGFLVQPKGKEIEEVGDKYFDDLVARSFFQRSSVNPACFTMHDLVNDMAKFVSGEFCFRFEDEDSSKPTKRARHISYARKTFEASEIFEAIDGIQLLRSFLLIGWPQMLRYSNTSIALNPLQNLKFLRTLSLSWFPDDIELPDSIGDLKHLRYLNFEYTKIKKLPQSVCSLYNLETLIFYECRGLVELPSNMTKLHKLCHLDIRGTNLRVMPQQMGKLVELRKLTDFLVGKEGECGIAELGKLQHLRGELCIWDLQNVVNVQDALEANLKSKKHIKELQLRWFRYGDYSSHVPEQADDTVVSEHQMQILEKLQPHTNVRSLSIAWYGGASLPDWLGDSSFLNIVSMKLSCCRHCSSLPPLGQLVSLKDLSIREFDALVNVGTEFYGSYTSMKKPFGSLEILRFEKMAKWQEWISDIDGAFPVLQELYIRDCPNLTKALPSHLLSLKTLVIKGCDRLVLLLPRAPAVRNLSLRDSSYSNEFELNRLSYGLQSLHVRKFHSLDSPMKVIEQMGVISSTLEEILISECDLESFNGNEESPGDFTSLKSLDIWSCPNFVSFHQGKIYAPNLIRLALNSCKSLKSLPESMHSLLPSLAELAIGNCPEIESIPERLPSKLASLSIYDCHKLSANLGRQWDLLLLPSLTHLVINVECFPLLPPTLVYLNISKVLNVKCLDRERLQHLSFLTELRIWEWPDLQCILEEGLPSSLSSLAISNLQNLQSLRIQQLASLEKLNITNCPKLESIPKEMLPSTLASFEIWDLQSLQSLGIKHLTSLNELKICGCPKLELIPKELPSSLASFEIWGLQSLRSLGIQHLTSLKELRIGSCPKLELIPGGLEIPSSLKFLEIWDLQSLKSLGIQHLNSLEKLKIMNCPKLELIPERLPSSLLHLEISQCPLLATRCQKEEGEDWFKISHIPNINIW